MYIYLGGNTVISSNEILGIFDMDTSTISKTTREYLTACEKNGRVVNVSMELPKSFVLCWDEIEHKPTVYISQISSSTLLKRSGYVDSLANMG